MYLIDRKSIIMKITGGSSILDKNRLFDIGRRNVVAIKRELWKRGFGIMKEDVGGSDCRTVTIETQSGNIVISNSRDIKYFFDKKER